MSFFVSLLLFVCKVVVVFLAIFLVLIMIASLKKQKRQQKTPSIFQLRSLNEYYEDMVNQFDTLLDKKELKQLEKTKKKEEKAKKKSEKEEPLKKPYLYVLDFDGDVQASSMEDVRDQISALIQIAKPEDEVLLRLNSPGGYVHSYGFASSQLMRFKEHGIKLTVVVDMVAASGGYMMACVADQLIAAPFAIIGSVGVYAGIPNINELLEKNHVHYEMHTAGKFKRTLTVMGKNTDEGRAQFQKELTETHELFKQHIQQMRPQLDVESIATGETWYGQVALEKGLVDKLGTSDDYIMAHLKTHKIVQLEKEEPMTIWDKLKHQVSATLQAPFLPFKNYIR
ncbi:hypothetical protein IX83_02680 [Basilea psittacipulmonis DSM 24701]|uniref:Peptidase n=2 Tax=Basilea TaxID=1472344 RepID=A0A077DDZ4_9BURK|nr:hypothetical protein IX83_02680 [Basilea psittacipulmonis DSM 24701]